MRDSYKWFIWFHFIDWKVSTADVTKNKSWTMSSIMHFTSPAGGAHHGARLEAIWQLREVWAGHRGRPSHWESHLANHQEVHGERGLLRGGRTEGVTMRRTWVDWAPPDTADACATSSMKTWEQLQRNVTRECLHSSRGHPRSLSVQPWVYVIISCNALRNHINNVSLNPLHPPHTHTSALLMPVWSPSMLRHTSKEKIPALELNDRSRPFKWIDNL